MEFWEALIELQDYKPETPHGHYVCKLCGLKTHYQWAMYRHLDNKHSDKLLELSGQAHGWNNASMGWNDKPE